MNWERIRHDAGTMAIVAGSVVPPAAFLVGVWTRDDRWASTGAYLGLAYMCAAVGVYFAKKRGGGDS